MNVRTSPQDPFGLEAMIADHLRALEAKGYAESTIRNRRSNLKKFRLWAEERGVTRPTEVTRPVLERYRQHLYGFRQANGAPYSWSIQTQRLIAVKMLLRWLTRENYLLYNPAAELELPRQAKYLPASVFSVSEVEQVLAEPDVTDPVGLRDRAILETFYSTGMRRMELVNLALDDLSIPKRTLQIRQGKGRKDRVVPVGERALRWLERYLVEVRPELVVGHDDRRLFLNNRGRPYSLNRMTELCRRYVAASGVGKEGSCHVFRHTAATLMLEGGADIRYIQQLLGHEHLASTEVYTRVTISKLQEVHAATHPGATLERRRRDGDELPRVGQELLEAIAAEADDERTDVDDRSDDAN